MFSQLILSDYILFISIFRCFDRGKPIHAMQIVFFVDISRVWTVTYAKKIFLAKITITMYGRSGGIHFIFVVFVFVAVRRPFRPFRPIRFRSASIRFEWLGAARDKNVFLHFLFWFSRFRVPLLASSVYQLCGCCCHFIELRHKQKRMRTFHLSFLIVWVDRSCALVRWQRNTLHHKSIQINRINKPQSMI